MFKEFWINFLTKIKKKPDFSFPCTGKLYTNWLQGLDPIKVKPDLQGWGTMSAKANAQSLFKKDRAQNFDL